MSNARAKISSSKVAKKLSSLANTKGAKGLTKATGLLSKYFLAKSIVNRIMHGDTASLTMLGVRIGGEVGLKVAIKLGMKVFSSASKVGKAFTALGKIAGPLETAADIGLSVYSLMKSVERRNSVGNVFDKRYANSSLRSRRQMTGQLATVSDFSKKILRFEESSSPLDFRYRLFSNYIRPELRSRDGKIDMSLKSIEQVNGRKNEGEELTADRFIRKISLQGGNYERPDLIKLKKHTFENLGEISDHTTTYCRPNVTIIVKDYTTIESEGTMGNYLNFSWKFLGISNNSVINCLPRRFET
ncbi:unnamed protein product [Orchesella dallaii]|uniref:Uncharacterized protein n=1 Tax=Orchesella dallaii TaxID=48710 RepID=A0ABP1RWN2_9HEXA